MRDLDERLRDEGTRWRAAQPAPEVDVAAVVAGGGTARVANGRRLGVVAAAAAVLAVVVSAGVATRRDAPPTASAEPTPEPTPTTEPTPTAEPEESPTKVPPVTAPACRAGNVRVSRGPSEGATGGLMIHTLYVLNTGDAPCSLTGQARGAAVAESGEQMRVGTWPDYAEGEPPRDVHPGQQATLTLTIRNEGWCEGQPMVRSVVLRLPGGDVPIENLDRGCGVSLGPYGGVAAEEDSGGIEGVTVTAEPVRARPGAAASFRVTVTNRSGQAVELSCAGPYRVRLAGVVPEPDQRHLPGCRRDSSQVVRPGETRTLTYRVYVPRTLAGRRVTLRWSYGGLSAAAPVDVAR
jgi:hypothetical protein